MKLKVIQIIIILLLISCVDKNTLPKGVLTEDEIVNVITEIELTQALIKLKFSNSDTLVNRQELYDQVFDEYNITQENFNNSLTHYCAQPKGLDDIYVKVISNLSEKQENYK